MKTWRDYAPNDPEGLRPFVEYLISQTFTKPMREEFLEGKESSETYDDAYNRVMVELKEYIDNYDSSSTTNIEIDEVPGYKLCLVCNGMEEVDGKDCTYCNAEGYVKKDEK